MIQAQRLQARDRAGLVLADHPAVADHVRGQNRRELPIRSGAMAGTLREIDGDHRTPFRAEVDEIRVFGGRAPRHLPRRTPGAYPCELGEAQLFRAFCPRGAPQRTLWDGMEGTGLKPIGSGNWRDGDGRDRRMLSNHLGEAAMLRVRAVILASALILAPSGARAADLVIWWEQGYYAQEDAADQRDRRCL